MLRIVAALAGCCALFVQSLSAAAETRVALVVGNSAYVHTATLANPLNDARDVAAALKGVGFDVVEALDADKAKLDTAMRSFAAKLGAADVALFFYAGHGLQLGAQNFLVPVDARLERERDLEFEAVKLDFVLRQMEIDREGKTSIVFLDACRDNPLSRNLARSMGTRSASIGRGLAAASTGLGTFIAFSTQPGNVALDGEGRNSPFTAALLKHLGTRGNNLPATMIEVRKEVVSATNGSQVPWDHSALTGEFYFVPGPASPVPAAAGTAPPAAPSADVAALQERLRKLEEDAQTRRAAPEGLTADQMRLAELRARAANLKELVQDLQRKVLTARMEEGKATDPAEKERRKKDAMNVQLEMTRRGLDLKKLQEEIAALEGAPASGVSGVPPGLSGRSPDRTEQGFDIFDRVVLAGDVIKSSAADSARSCAVVCRNTPECRAAAFDEAKRGTLAACAVLRSVSQATPGATGSAALLKAE